MGPRGKELREKVKKDAKTAQEKVARMVSSALGQSLKELWIGDTIRFEMRRDESGGLVDWVRHDDLRAKIAACPCP